MFGGNTSSAGAGGDVYFLFLTTSGSSPGIYAYTCYANGFGNRYANPASLPSSSYIAPIGCGTAFFTLGNNSDLIMYTGDAYPWSGAGFGTKYAAPSPTLGTATRGVAINKVPSFLLGSYYTGVAFGANNPSPYVAAYRFTSNGGFGSPYSAPATPPLGDSGGLAFSPSGNALAFCSNDTRVLNSYAWANDTGFGTKYSNPTGLIAFATGRYGVAFTSDNAVVFFTSNSTGNIQAYPWSDSTGLGTKYSDPATAAPSSSNAVAVNPNNTAVAVVGSGSPYISVYPWSNSTGFGTKYNDPASALPGAAYSVAFSPDNKIVAVGTDASPYITLYEWSDSTGFGNKLDAPLSPPTSGIRGITFSNIL